MITIFHATTLVKRMVCRGVLIGLGFAAVTLPLPADPTPSLDQLYVVDQGRQITVIWHFYYKLLPPNFTLREKKSQIIALDAPSSLKQDLTDLASVAFELTLDGQPAPLVKISELTLAPDGGCFATLLFPGRKNGHLQVRETILPYYPPSYVINYAIYNPRDKTRGISGYFTGGAVPPVVDYVQLDSDIEPSIFDRLNATPFKLFKAELRTAWINTNWLFLAILLVLTRPPKELYPLGLIMAAAWILPRFFWVMDNLQIPLTLHPLIPALATAAICFLCLHRSPRFPGLAIPISSAGLLNGCFDIQQTSLERPAPDVANLIGMGLGFVASLALVFAVGFPLVAECRKLPGFDRDWKPKIGWALAILALILPWVKT